MPFLFRECTSTGGGVPISPKQEREMVIQVSARHKEERNEPELWKMGGLKGMQNVADGTSWPSIKILKNGRDANVYETRKKGCFWEPWTACRQIDGQGGK